jgi:hypothetical protein
MLIVTIQLVRPKQVKDKKKSHTETQRHGENKIRFRGQGQRRLIVEASLIGMTFFSLSVPPCSV